jgi:cyclopropane fatty-acyl-phospholipid synthase-like methyltransferase
LPIDLESDKYKITFETWNKVAAIYQDKFMGVDLYNDTYDQFCNLVKPDSKILEIGCGPGNITKYLLSKRPDLRIEGIDVAPNMIELARQNNPSAKFKVMDGREIDTLNEKYDAIICGFCIPYLSKEDLTKLVKDCSLLLNETGIFYFSAIEGDHANSGFEAGSSGDKAFVYYYSQEFLEQELKNANLELLNFFRKEYPKTNEAVQTHLIFIARTKEQSIKNS